MEMKPTKIRVRLRRRGGHIEVTFWTGRPDYTFANVGTLVMDENDANLFREIMYGNPLIQSRNNLEIEEEL